MIDIDLIVKRYFRIKRNRIRRIIVKIVLLKFVVR